MIHGARAIGAVTVAVALALTGYFALPRFFETVASSRGVVTSNIPDAPRITHVPTPDAVRGIYMTGCIAGSKELRSKLVKLVEETEINSIVIDIKNETGRIFMPVSHPDLLPAEGGACYVADIEDFIRELHSKDIYVIGRIAAFQDRFYAEKHPEDAVKRASDGALWRDGKGIPWVDAGAKHYWDYLVEIGKEAYALGYDELNYDYIRFPSDGNMNDIRYDHAGTRPKPEVMREFYSYLHEQLSGTGAVLSADLFGMTTTNTDDLNIGQILENALPFFDYIAPMVYPSHYPSGFNGYKDVNKYPYEIVKYSMDKAVERIRTFDATVASTTIQKLRPWLQDNNYPVPYTPEMVRAQIQAIYDAGLTSWMLWNAGNRYSRGALEAVSTSTSQR